MLLIVAREKPSILKLTFLQLIEFCFNCSKSCSFDNVSAKFSVTHTNDSSKNLVRYQNDKKQWQLLQKM